MDASLTHALSGATGTSLTAALTYPLDLVTTRLKAQRQLALDGALAPEETYTGTLDAFRAIYAREGGIPAFFAGLGTDLAKTGVDSFLWFLFYNLFRAEVRLKGGVGRGGHGEGEGDGERPGLRGFVEELMVGSAAGACARLLTTPVGNVVTRRQMGRLLGHSNSDDNGDSGGGDVKGEEDRGFWEVVEEIRQERGVLGLWAGYSASLVLTLNPSITFFLQQALKRALVPRARWEDPGARTTFLLAAVSKVVATAVTYPFQIAKARVQVSAAPGAKGEGVKGAARDNIFATVLRIARAEGARALYDGIGGELLKGFFSHGTTMLSKDVIHRLIVQLYFAILAALRRYPQFGTRLAGRMRRAREEVKERYLRASSSGANEVRKRAQQVKSAVDSGHNTPANWLRTVHSKVDG